MQSLDEELRGMSLSFTFLLQDFGCGNVDSELSAGRVFRHELFSAQMN
jgi:hypothetical protein